MERKGERPPARDLAHDPKVLTAIRGVLVSYGVLGKELDALAARVLREAIAQVRASGKVPDTVTGWIAVAVPIAHGSVDDDAAAQAAERDLAAVDSVRGASPVPVSKPAPGARPSRRRAATAGLVAALVLAAVAIAVLERGMRRAEAGDGGVAAAQEGASAEPSLLALARALREQAARDCNASRWADCQGDLERAAVKDPEGAERPEVARLREQAELGLRLEQLRASPAPAASAVSAASDAR